MSALIRQEHGPEDGPEDSPEDGPVRVIQVINHFGTDHGGAERLAWILHQDLLEAGVDAHLVALGSSDPGQISGTVSLGFGTPRDPRVVPALARTLKQLRTRRTVVHGHLFPTSLHLSVLRQAGRLRSPCAMTEHSTWNRRRGHPVLRLLDRAIYRGFDQVVAISEQTRDALLDSYPALARRTSTICNGSALHFKTPPDRTDPAVPCLLTVARLAPAKNLGMALDALAMLRDRPWRYVIAGDGPERAMLQARAAALDLGNRVSFLGQVKDVPSVLAAADVFLLPSRWEGFGLAAVEAMNAALPVVASTAAGLRDVVEPAGNPVVDPDDTAGLARAIAALLDDPSRRRTIGQANFDRARLYDKGLMTRAYRDLWQKMTAGRKA